MASLLQLETRVFNLRRPLKVLIKELLRTAPLVHPHPGLRDRAWRVKYCLRGLARARLTREWFRLLRTPGLERIARAHPHIRSKLQRAYLTRALGPKERLAALKCHYSFILQRFPEAMLRQVYMPHGFLLASLPLAELGNFSLRLAYCHSLGKEGDLTIRFEDEAAHRPIYSLTFSVTVDEPEHREAIIGGLQGYTRGEDNERVISLTRRMHGLRPKALVLFTLQQFACVWDFTNIRAVTDAMHIYRHYLRRKEVAARYDDFWRESGGLLAADNLFDLPVLPAMRPTSTIKASKRAMYKRRYAMLEEIAHQIQASVGNSRRITRSAGVPRPEGSAIVGSADAAESRSPREPVGK